MGQSGTVKRYVIITVLLTGACTLIMTFQNCGQSMVPDQDANSSLASNIPSPMVAPRFKGAFFSGAASTYEYWTTEGNHLFLSIPNGQLSDFDFSRKNPELPAFQGPLAQGFMGASQKRLYFDPTYDDYDSIPISVYNRTPSGPVLAGTYQVTQSPGGTHEGHYGYFLGERNDVALIDAWTHDGGIDLHRIILFDFRKSGGPGVIGAITVGGFHIVRMIGDELWASAEQPFENFNVYSLSSLRSLSKLRTVVGSVETVVNLAKEGGLYFSHILPGGQKTLVQREQNNRLITQSELNGRFVGANGSRVLIRDNLNVFKVFELSNPQAPVEIYSDDGHYSYSVSDVRNGIALLTGQGQVDAIDFRTQNVQSKNMVISAEPFNRATFVGDKVVIGGAFGGFMILDLTSASTSTSESQFETCLLMRHTAGICN